MSKKSKPAGAGLLLVGCALFLLALAAGAGVAGTAAGAAVSLSALLRALRSVPWWLAVFSFSFCLLLASALAAAAALYFLPLTVRPSLEKLTALLLPTPPTRPMKSAQSLKGALWRSWRMRPDRPGPMPLMPSSSASVAVVTSMVAGVLGVEGWNGGSEFFDPACGVAVPGLAAGALPEMLAGLEATGRTAVAGQGLDRVVQRALDLGVKFFVFQLFGGQPLGSGDQRALFVQVLHVALPGGGAGGLVGGFHGHDALQHIPRRGLRIVGLEQGVDLFGAPGGRGGFDHQWGGQRQCGRVALAQGLECGQHCRRLAHEALQARQLNARACSFRGGGHGLFQQGLGTGQVALGTQRLRLLAQVVGLAGAEVALVRVVHLSGDGGCVGPVA